MLIINQIKDFLVFDEIKKYQEKIQSDYVNPWDKSEKIDHYMNQGVNLHDAKIMAHFSVFLRKDLILANIHTELYNTRDDMHSMFHYKINSDGRITELHIHHADTILLTLFPYILSSLDHLEVIRFPNNGIEFIPECITNLTRLKVLELSNFGFPNPIIPDSIRSFIESLEHFNDFYD